MHTIRLLVEYDGTKFSGWQRQSTLPQDQTVQGALDKAVSEMVGAPTSVSGASRTDAGVHARAQVAAFRTDNHAIPMVGFLRGLTTLTPAGITIKDAAVVDDSFDPRRLSRGKRYRYVFLETIPSAIDQHRAWWTRYLLNVEDMEEAGQALVGSHDFTSFRSVHCTAAHATRRMYSIKVFRGEYDRIHLEVLGNAFVRNMVRIIAGTLFEVGRGSRPVDSLADVLAAKDRTQAGMTAPAHGLYLEEVIYDDRLPPRPTGEHEETPSPHK